MVIDKKLLTNSNIFMNKSELDHFPLETGLIPLLSSLQSSTHLISDALINGKATSHMAKPEDSQRKVLFINLC